MFALKKTIAAFLMPLPFMLFIGLTGLLVLWFTRHKFIASLLILIAFAGILLASLKPVSSVLLAHMEQQYKGYIPSTQPVDYIMVLGHGHVMDNHQPITSRLSRTALVRLTEGIRILRLHPEAKLILSGYKGGTSISQARMMATAAQSLAGINPDDTILLETPRNTLEEATQAVAVVGNKRLVLVTSASHMPRAMIDFQQQGLQPIPAPTEFLGSDSDISQFWRYAPNARNLEQTELFWRETMGLWWQKLSNWLL